MLIASTKSEVKSIVKNLSENARVAVDTVFAYAPELKEANDRIAEAEKSVAPVLCKAFSQIASDKDGIKKCGYDKFEDFASVLFGQSLGGKTASMLKRVGDKFYNVEKPPVVGQWFTPSKLQELRNVDNKKLDEDAASGVLRPDMTMAELRAYATKPAIDDGTERITNGFCGVLLSNMDKFTVPTLEDIYRLLNGGETPLADNIHDTSSVSTIVIPARDDKHKSKEIKTRLLLVERVDGSVAVARYWKNPAVLSKEDKAKAELVKRTLERAGIDCANMTYQELLDMAG